MEDPPDSIPVYKFAFFVKVFSIFIEKNIESDKKVT